MPYLPLFSILLAACTGPYCGPDTDFERPTGDVAGEAAAPAAALGADGAVLVAWEHRIDGESDVLFNRREPGPDGSWGAVPIRLDTDPAGAARSLEPRIAAGPGGLVVTVWQDARDGRDDIRFNRSTNGGRTWLAADLRLDTDAPGAATSSMPALATDGIEGSDGGGRVVVAWEDGRNGERDLFLRISADGGETWGPETRIDSDEPGTGVSYHPQVSIWPDGAVLALWWDERDGRSDLYVRRGTSAPDGAVVWGGPERRLDPGDAGAEPSRDARLAGAGDRVAVAWEEVAPGGRSSVRVRTSGDRGATWDPGRRLGTGVDPAPWLAGGAAGGSGAGWLAPPGSGALGVTSIGGRIVEIPAPVGLKLSTGAGESGADAVALSQVEGPSALWMGGGSAGPDPVWAVRTGSSIGRGVVEIFRGTPSGNGAAVAWRRARTILFGQSLQGTSVPVSALGPGGAVGPDALHVVWVARVGDVDDLGAVRVPR